MKNQPIECEVCNKVCNNLKGYTIHKLFHDTRNFTTSTGEKIASEGLNSSKGLLICEVKNSYETAYLPDFSGVFIFFDPRFGVMKNLKLL